MCDPIRLTGSGPRDRSPIDDRRQWVIWFNAPISGVLTLEILSYSYLTYQLEVDRSPILFPYFPFGK